MEQPLPRSAADVVGPAFERTKAVLFRPYQWRRWWRIALIGMATAVIGTANGCNLGGLRDFRVAAAKDPKFAELLQRLYEYISPAQLAALLTVLIVGALVLAMVHIYVNSVARFMMFDAMTTGAVRIRQGWNKWHGHGLRLFGFQFALAAAVTAALSLLGYLFSASSESARGNPSAVLVGVLAMLAGTWLFAILAISFHQLSTDFMVPVMALEGVELWEAFRRVWKMAMEKPGDFVIYLLIKMALVIIVSMALFLVEMALLLVPLIAVVVVMVVAVKSVAGDPQAVVLVVGLGVMVCIAGIVFVIALVAAPTYVFFQGYALEFWADRYPPLKAALYPPPPISGPAM